MGKASLQIRNSTVDFLIFTRDKNAEGVEVRVQDNMVWVTQKALGQLFEVDRSVVAKHLRNIYAEGEVDEVATCAKFAQVADNGKTYQYKFYALAVVIAVGYRINSARATAFRIWATKVLETFTQKGYVLDKDRLKNGPLFGEDYFEHLVAELQEIRASERRFYQKITDIYSTSVDYSFESPITREFFATVQNKMHYAVHQQTVAEGGTHRTYGTVADAPMGQRDHQQTFLFLRKVANLTNPLNSAQGRFCFAVSSPSMTDLRRDKSINISTSRTVLHAACAY